MAPPSLIRQQAIRTSIIFFLWACGAHHSTEARTLGFQDRFTTHHGTGRALRQGNFLHDTDVPVADGALERLFIGTDVGFVDFSASSTSQNAHEHVAEGFQYPVAYADLAEEELSPSPSVIPADSPSLASSPELDSSSTPSSSPIPSHAADESGSQAVLDPDASFSEQISSSPSPTESPSPPASPEVSPGTVVSPWLEASPQPTSPPHEEHTSPLLGNSTDSIVEQPSPSPSPSPSPLPSPRMTSPRPSPSPQKSPLPKSSPRAASPRFPSPKPPRAPSPKPSPKPSPQPSPLPSPLPSPMPSPSPPPRKRASILYGREGELMTDAGRLTDWSWAGYKFGNEPVPSPPATLDFKADFGAVGDGVTSDQIAFEQAFAAAPAGAVLYLPPGRYILEKPINRKLPIVMRGAGRDLTTIYLPYSLADLNPWIPKGPADMSPYRDAPFFINFAGTINVNFERTFIGRPIENAEIGDTAVTVICPVGRAPPPPGTNVRLIAVDKNMALVSYIYGVDDYSQSSLRDASELRNDTLLWFTNTIKSVTPIPSPNNQQYKIDFVRPLAFAFRPLDWGPVQLHILNANLNETGIEDITFEHPPRLYPGHFKEAGYNTLSMSGCTNSWARRLKFINHDIGLSIGGSTLMTVDDIVFTTTIDRSGGRPNQGNGHHHIRVSRSTDVVSKNLKFEVPYIHDITFDHSALLNVFHNATSPDLTMDFHSSGSARNLLSAMWCGACTKQWASGGAAGTGSHAGVGNVAWGITGNPNAKMSAPPREFGMNFTIIGMKLGTSMPNYNNMVVEAFDGVLLEPWDLQQDMLQRRKAREAAAVASQ